MYRRFRPSLLINALLLVFLSLLASCASSTQAPTPTFTPQPSSTPSPIPPTGTPLPTMTPTVTLTPTATPLPGALVIPLDTMAGEIPWLPLDKTVRPGVNYLGFNFERPPFNSALVRQAFAHAIDREAIADLASRYKAMNVAPATNLTPPQTLGRDLYEQVGLEFDPDLAQSLLREAGYSDPSAFPQVLLLVNAYGDIAPGARFNMASAMVEMWEQNLGISSIRVEAISVFGAYGQRLRENPPELFWLGWVADSNDPDNFLREVFHTDSEYNYGHFTDNEYDQLIDEAANLRSPQERMDNYLAAERILCETQAAIIPLYHSTYNLP